MDPAELDEESQDHLRDIMSSMINQRRWGGRHSQLDTLTRCLRRTDADQRSIERVLSTSDWFLTKPNGGELHVSLNPRKTAEIRRFCKLPPPER